MSEKTFQRGQPVRFHFVNRPVRGVITEDRGPIGLKGRVLYRIEFPSQSDSPEMSVIELPADRLELVEDDVTAEAPKS